jgi:hypothetical protein
MSAPAAQARDTVRKVFISNLASDEGRGQTYNRFYAAMLNSTGYEMVTTPARADLIFELRYSIAWRCRGYSQPSGRSPSPRKTLGRGPHQPSRPREEPPYPGQEHPFPVPRQPSTSEPVSQITLTVWDRKTNKLEGVFTEPINSAYLRSKDDRNFQDAIEELVSRATGEPSQVRAVHFSPGRALDAPLPAEISAATKVFISNRDSERIHGIEAADAYDPEFRWTMKKWGRFQLVSNPSEADLVFEIFLTEKHPDCVSVRSSDLQRQMELRVLEPNNDFALWGFAQPAGSLDGTAKRLVDQVRQLVTRADRDAHGQASTTAVHP